MLRAIRHESTLSLPADSTPSASLSTIVELVTRPSTREPAQTPRSPFPLTATSVADMLVTKAPTNVPFGVPSGFWSMTVLSTWMPSSESAMSTDVLPSIRMPHCPLSEAASEVTVASRLTPSSKPLPVLLSSWA